MPLNWDYTGTREIQRPLQPYQCNVCGINKYRPGGAAYIIVGNHQDSRIKKFKILRIFTVDKGVGVPAFMDNIVRHIYEAQVCSSYKSL